MIPIPIDNSNDIGRHGYRWPWPQLGWQCPVCGTVHAPRVPSCGLPHDGTVASTQTQPNPDDEDSTPEDAA